MTEADKQRKIASQFRRRLEAKMSISGKMQYKLGTKDYLEAYDKFFKKQGGKCAICEKPWVEGSKRLHLDHNHENGQLRGLLCWSCNTRLGFLEKYFYPIMKYLRIEVIQ